MTMTEGSVINEGISVVECTFDEDPVDLADDLEGLGPDEIKAIQEVLEKDKNLRLNERERRRKVEETFEENIVSIEMKNVDSGEKFCSVCAEKFMVLFNPRQICDQCNMGACTRCIKKYTEGKICSLCYLKDIRDVQTGRWFFTTSKTNGRFRRSASVVILNSMRKLKARFFTHKPEERRSSGSLEMVQEFRNGDVHRPIFQPKRRSLPKMKEEITKRADVIGPTPESVEIDPVIPPIRFEEPDKSPHHSNSFTLPPVQVVNRNHLDVPDSGTMPHRLSNLDSMKQFSLSTASVYSETEESYKSGIPVSGEILFSVSYDDDRRALLIYVDQCRNIAVADRKKRKTDPYIKTYLLPDKTKISKKKSSCKKSALNPVFKETLMYYLEKGDLMSRTLSIAVWHKSSLLGYNLFLGEVQVVISDRDLSNKECMWYQLREKLKYPLRSGGLIYKGELSIKLKYLRSTIKDGKGTLQILVCNAQKLESEHGSTNAYVKAHLLPDRKVKQKTTIMKGINPRWDYMLSFHTTAAELKDRSLELAVYHHNKLKSNEFLGGIRLNLGLGLCNSQHVAWMDSQGIEKDTWDRFISNPENYTEAIIPLRPNLDY